MADESLLNDSNLGALGSNDDDSELILEVSFVLCGISSFVLIYLIKSIYCAG